MTLIVVWRIVIAQMPALSRTPSYGVVRSLGIHSGHYPPHLVLLILYFLVLALRASYDLHRYILVFQYYRQRKNGVSAPAAHFDEDQLPMVTIQLPIFNEQFVVERLVDAVCKLDYPREKLEIQVLDDSTDETVELASKKVAFYAALGHDIHYLHRDNQTGYKAGALAAGTLKARGEFIAIFDADFVPQPDWLGKVIHYFTDSNIGVVQTRWAHINRNYSLLTKAQAILLDGHFVLEQGARSRSGLFFNFNGTAGIWRRTAIEDAGGWQCDTLTEDTDLSYRAQLKGWRFVYLQDIECPSELPVEMTAFKTQHARWAKGLTQVAKKMLPRILRSNVPLKVKVEAWYHLTTDAGYLLSILLSGPLLPAMVIWSFQDWFLPLFVTTAFSISLFYVVSQKELFPGRWYWSLVYLPVFMAVDIALTFTNTRAVLEGLFGKQSEFIRTPKYRVVSRSDRPLGNKYRKRLGLVPWIELAAGGYFVLTFIYALQIRQFIALPFLALFVTGFWYSGLMSLLQGRFDLPLLRSEPKTSSKDKVPVPFRDQTVLAGANGAISGAVTDSRGATIPDVEVELNLR